MNTWNLDNAHSELRFRIKHMMIAHVSGQFKIFNAVVHVSNDDFTTAKIEFDIDAKSIDTANEQRDQHLRSADFFDCENHPKIEFRSSSVVAESASRFMVSGVLSMHGHSRDILFHADFGGIGKDPWGNTKAGFTIEGKIKRSDFGLVWNAPLESGGLLVSDEVMISGELQFAKG